MGRAREVQAAFRQHREDEHDMHGIAPSPRMHPHPEQEDHQKADRLQERHGEDGACPLLCQVGDGEDAVPRAAGAASGQRIQEVLACEPRVTDAGNAPLELPAAGADAVAVRLDGVGFTYAGARVPALEGVTLELRQGQTLGIIGGTGSGKSTLANLLPRLYDASRGTVQILGHDVRDYTFEQLRGAVSIVPQHASLVTGTIRSNLCWRKPDATDAELWDALEKAQAADFVHQKPNGLDEVVEAGGKNFSGGQRQRLTIARALVGHPRICVLDDSASALDFKTDARLRHALRALSGELTSVVISQRVSAVMSADQVLVLDHGRMAGLGTHQELLASCGLYREIVDSQLGAREVA